MLYALCHVMSCLMFLNQESAFKINWFKFVSTEGSLKKFSNFQCINCWHSHVSTCTAWRAFFTGRIDYFYFHLRRSRATASDRALVRAIEIVHSHSHVSTRTAWRACFTSGGSALYTARARTWVYDNSTWDNCLNQSPNV